jgi:hypothetical protein
VNKQLRGRGIEGSLKERWGAPLATLNQRARRKEWKEGGGRWNQTMGDQGRGEREVRAFAVAVL